MPTWRSETGSVWWRHIRVALCYAADSFALNPEYGKAYALLGLSRFSLEDYQGELKLGKYVLLFKKGIKFLCKRLV